MKYNVIERKNPLTEAPIFYAVPTRVQVVTLPTIAEEISQECTLTPHDIRAVISALEERVAAHVLQGNSVRFGLLGSFRPTFKCTSTPTAESFNSKYIKSINVVFTKSATLRHKLSKDNPNVKFEREDSTKQ